MTSLSHARQGTIMMTKFGFRDFSCGKTKVHIDPYSIPMARERSVSDVCEVVELRQSIRGELEGIVYATRVRCVPCHPYTDGLLVGVE